MLKSEFEAAKLQNNYMPNYYLKITSAISKSLPQQRYKLVGLLTASLYVR